MEKIRFNNGLELEITPMGISKSNNNLTISIIATIGYDELEGVISDYSNISTIEVISQNGEIMTTFKDCINYTQLSKIKDAYKNEQDETFDIFVVTFNCNEIQGILGNLNSEIEVLKVNNQKLEEKSTELEEKSAELQAKNHELEEKSKALEEQNMMLTECMLEISELIYV